MPLSLELEKLLRSLSCCDYRGDQHTHILIEENGSQAKLRNVILDAPAGNWFSFNPDKGRGKEAIMSPLLAIGSEHNHHRACDCVVIICREEKILALYIDLKSGNPVGYSGQFKSTRQFLRYALGLLKEFYGYQITLEERYIVLYGGKPTLINKKPTVPKKSNIVNTEPNAPYKLEVHNPCRLYLKELLV